MHVISITEKKKRNRKTWNYTRGKKTYIDWRYTSNIIMRQCYLMLLLRKVSRPTRNKDHQVRCAQFFLSSSGQKAYYLNEIEYMFHCFFFRGLCCCCLVPGFFPSTFFKHRVAVGNKIVRHKSICSAPRFDGKSYWYSYRIQRMIKGCHENSNKINRNMMSAQHAPHSSPSKICVFRIHWLYSINDGN